MSRQRAKGHTLSEVKVTDAKLNISERIIYEAIRPALERALNRVGERGVQELRDALMTPVEIDPVTGWLIRSNPGEPPRKETGELLNNLGADIIPNASDMSVTLIIKSERPSTPEAPDVLEYGGGAWDIEPRPYMTPQFREMQTYWVQMVVDALEGKKS